MKVYGFTGKTSGIMEIDNSLEATQAFVEGHIECVCLTSELVMVLNEEGKIYRLKPTAVWVNGADLLDVLCGNFFICRFNEEGEFISINEEDVEIIEKLILTMQA